ncbi:Nucleoside diphosphate-linked moiety X motif 17 [Hyphodiscus hymeniophilus]|uniref:Nucleoside diphosphate-linked moiety X motif 17 n=1 Tax=Hyphodiscus hymeniophilus TaxID=353542 RepID=A0A9P6VIS1_9HELO|nr:Nucleoside diphosphate-linked moiety X motif 17 [Hyphodiscus hymeniophilus]
MAPTPPPPFTFTVPASLSALNVPMATFLQTHPSYDVLASGAFVFDSSNRILLLQRASHDTLPNLWETPGGAVDASDSTILDGVARELWEEAGLVVKAFREQVGVGREFRTARKGLVVFKVEIWVEVESAEHVTLDPDEHQRFVWAMEEECKRGRVGRLGSAEGDGDGGFEIEFTCLEQQESILEAFRIRKEVEGLPKADRG